MGCWNETCFLTKLPILFGEKIVVLPLIQNFMVDPEAELSMSHSFDRWKPLSFPFRATYNDYGNPENIIKEFEYDLFNFMIEEYLSDKDKIKIRSHHDNYDISLWDHISSGKAFHKIEDMITVDDDKLFYISSIMIKATVFDNLVKEEPEHDYNSITKKYLEDEDFVKFIDCINSSQIDTAPMEKRESSKIYTLLFENYDTGFGHTKSHILDFLRQHIHKYDENKIKKTIVNFVLFIEYLECLRLVLAPTTGKGSQRIEKNVHSKLNMLQATEIKKIVEMWD